MAIGLFCLLPGSLSPALAQTTATALVRHAPTISGTVEGSVQQTTAETVTLNGGAAVTGDLLVPGTPAVQLNGHPDFGGVIAGAGGIAPAGYEVILNGNALLGHLRTRTEPASFTEVPAPPASAGTRQVIVTAAGQSAGDFATVRDVTLKGNVGQVAIPPGTYGDLTANGGSGFTLGVAEGKVQTPPLPSHCSSQGTERRSCATGSVEVHGRT